VNPCPHPGSLVPRISRISVIWLTAAANRPDRRAPALPPSASSTACSTAVTPGVRRAFGLVSPGTCSANVFFPHPSARQITTSAPAIAVANPIYREVIVREPGAGLDRVLTIDKRRFALPDGRLDFRLILEELAELWPEHDGWLGGFDYREAAMQIMFIIEADRDACPGLRADPRSGRH
jgi:hypothetical protein